MDLSESPEYRRTDGLIGWEGKTETEGQRDAETEREAGRKRDALGLLTLPSAVWIVSEQRLL